MEIASTVETHREINRTKMVLFGVALIAGVAFVVWLDRSASATRIAAAQERAAELSAESRAICEKWGMTLGTQNYADCFADLQHVRDRQAQRFAEDFFP